MDDHDFLAARFEEHRAHLRSVAYRVLGSLSEADDAVQEAWLRLSRSDPSEVENLGGWLTTIVARVSLNMLRSRTSRREEPLTEHDPGEAGSDPEHQALLGDSVSLALLVVLDRLAPAERLAFVLHDMFDVPFDEIAPIVERSPAATRQLASRARRRVQGAAAPAAESDLARRREVVKAFVAASREGDFEALVTLLDPDVVLRADRAAVAAGAPKLMGSEGPLRGASAVAKIFSGRAKAARPALIDGTPGLVWTHRGETLMVFDFTIAEGEVVAIDLIGDPELIGELDVEIIKN